MGDQQAGWYPDPSGDASKLRYWDGSQWTNDFTEAQQAVQAAEPVQSAQVAQPTEPAQSPQPQPVQSAQPQVVIQETSYSNPATGGQTRVDQVYTQAPTQQTNGLAIAALICGIVGLCPYGFAVPSIAAIILGALGRKNPVNKGMAIAGIVLGIVALVIWIIVFIFAVIFATVYY